MLSPERTPVPAAAAMASLGPVSVASPPRRVLVFDSGLGGLTVLAEVVKVLPHADILFVADDAVFPYGRLGEAELVDRVMAVMAVTIARHRPHVVVIACHTASTLVLPPLRRRWPAIAFVGTVPAIKPAATLSRSRLVSVLATPGTVARQYTRDLVAEFAGDCAVTLVGASRLAALAEASMRGERVADAAIAAEIAPAFVTVPDGRRTDVVVLACTHYPLLLPALQTLAPWRVGWIDPAPAIARRVVQVAGPDTREPEQRDAPPSTIPALFTSGTAPSPALARFLEGRGLRWQPEAAF